MSFKCLQIVQADTGKIFNIAIVSPEHQSHEWKQIENFTSQVFCKKKDPGNFTCGFFSFSRNLNSVSDCAQICQDAKDVIFFTCKGIQYVLLYWRMLTA